jgi:hypothetical protein
MKQLLFVLLMLVCLNSCDDDENSFPQCEYSDPLEDLAWLKEYKETLTDCSTQISILQATYKKQTVFYSALTDPRVNSVFEATTLWDCEGNDVKRFGGDEYQEFGKLVTNRVVLYRCIEDSEVFK